MNDPAENTNTDTEIWRERPGDYYSDALFVTIDGALGIDVGGTVFVKPLRKWQELEAENAKLRAAIDECLLLSDGGSGDLAIEMKRRLRIARG